MLSGAAADDLAPPDGERVDFPAGRAGAFDAARGHLGFELLGEHEALAVTVGGEPLGTADRAGHRIGGLGRANANLHPGGS